MDDLFTFLEQTFIRRHIARNCALFDLSPLVFASPKKSSETAAPDVFEKMLTSLVSTLGNWSNSADAIASISSRLALNSACKSPVSPSDDQPSH